MLYVVFTLVRAGPLGTSIATCTTDIQPMLHANGIVCARSVAAARMEPHLVCRGRHPKSAGTQPRLPDARTHPTQDAVQQFGVKGLPGIQCYKDGACVENTVYATSHEVLTSLKTHGGEPPAPRRPLPAWARVALQTVAVRGSLLFLYGLHTTPHTGGCRSSCWLVAVRQPTTTQRPRCRACTDRCRHSAHTVQHPLSQVRAIKTYIQL